MALTAKLGTTDATLVGATLGAGVLGINPLEPSITHTLGLLDNTGPIEDVVDTLFMTDEVLTELLIDDFIGINQPLGLTQVVDTGLFPDVFDPMSMTDSATVTVFDVVSQNLVLNHWLSVGVPIPQTATDTLGITQLVFIPIEESLSHTLGLSDIASDTQKHELGLTDNAVAYLNASPHFAHDLGVSHTLQTTLIFTASVTHSNVVGQALTYYIDDGTNCVGNQFNNFGTLGVKPFTVSTGAKMTLNSTTGSGGIVVLRNPELDDRDRLGYTRINRESRGGELQIYRDPLWPIVNTLQGTIVGLKIADVDDLHQFFEDTLGEEISLNDWHGRYWRGVILNPDEPAVEDTNDRWTVSFEFEGVEMDGPDAIQQIGITDTMLMNADYTRDLTDTLGITDVALAVDNDVLHNGDNVQYQGEDALYGGPP